jgi:hypothetical protein
MRWLHRPISLQVGSLVHGWRASGVLTTARWVPSRPAFLDEDPFLTPFFFLLLSKVLPRQFSLNFWLLCGLGSGPTIDAFSFSLARLTARAFQFDGG